MPAPNAITPHDLLPLIGRPDCPALIDVTLDEDFAADPYLVPSAFRHAHTDLKSLLPRLGAQPAILICQKGRKLSQGAAAWLRTEGCPARYLDGGNMAWAAFDGAARLPASEIPDGQGGASLWVTGLDPDLRDIACLWLIRRFVDRHARILFVTRSEVEAVAERFRGTPLGGEETVAFDRIRARVSLETPPLDRISRSLHEVRDPLAPGFKALYAGLTRQFPDDDARLDPALALFDALYCWAQTEAAP
ncbi:MAG: chromate resistance protein ChrB domain-containing protein [Pseudomonadota bacterium]